MKVLQSWNKTQNNHLTTTARESGLYHLCFRKLGGSSEKFVVFYSFDFISTGALSSHPTARAMARRPVLG